VENARTDAAIDLMTHFAERTGLTSDRPPRRYLWTDAFAVCNLLALARETGDRRHEQLALRLVDQVHHVLGRHRPDERDGRGWISGLDDAEAEAHPTRGGLRIGKPLPERGPSEPLDPDLEWDRDGQYFHYLTKWMHALDQVARWTGDPRFDVWARELADAAHRAFTYGPPGGRRMAWKLSVDLRRPLVPSMGQHDPLDGFVTCIELEATAAALASGAGPSLRAATQDFAGMLHREALGTSDPLGIGGLLADACRLAQLDSDHTLIASLLEAAARGVKRHRAAPDGRAPAELRLAFRELGLAIGLAGIPMLQGDAIARRLDATSRASVAELARSLPLRDEIESFWLVPSHRRTSSWSEHADINDVMLATSLVPAGFLELGTPPHP
jgi:hypothetical protein